MLVVYDEMYTEHLDGVGHPESPDRVAWVAQHLERAGLFAQRIPARDAADDELTRVHSAAYLEQVKRDVAALGAGGVGYLSTGDTAIDTRSLDVARRAAGGALAALEAAATYGAPVFALVRPPGHHAEPARGMGFCLFNNAALAARNYVAQRGGRVLVVDFDYHHGNGTQAATGDGVSFVSTHAYPQYPMTGRAQESRFRADGAIVNVPLPPDYYSTEAFVATWQQLLPAVAAHVRPDAIVVSAGYDFAAGDPVGDLGIDGPLAARALAVLIREVAEQYAGGRVAFALEGGYNLATLAACVAATLQANDELARDGDRADPAAIPALQRTTIERAIAWQS